MQLACRNESNVDQRAALVKIQLIWVVHWGASNQIGFWPTTTNARSEGKMNRRWHAKRHNDCLNLIAFRDAKFSLNHQRCQYANSTS